jgi:hypothetical protein
VAIRQASAWGQWWFDLSERYSVHGCAIYTPLTKPNPQKSWRKPYYSIWYKSYYHNGQFSPVYKSVEGETLIEMLRDGLEQFGIVNLNTRLMLLEVALEGLQYRMDRNVLFSQ